MIFYCIQNDEFVEVQAWIKMDGTAWIKFIDGTGQSYVRASSEVDLVFVGLI